LDILEFSVFSQIPRIYPSIPLFSFSIILSPSSNARVHQLDSSFNAAILSMLHLKLMGQSNSSQITHTFIDFSVNATL